MHAHTSLSVQVRRMVNNCGTQGRFTFNQCVLTTVKDLNAWQIAS